MARKETLLSRRQVECLIAEGKNVIIVNEKVLLVDAWLKYHPGGDKTIMHMVGRDATDEVTACVMLSEMSRGKNQLTQTTNAVFIQPKLLRR